MAERLSAENFESRAFPEGRLSILDFYSDSCVPCKMLSPVLAELEEAYSDSIFVGKVNIAYETGLVEKYGIMGAPTLLFFKDGLQVEKLTGVRKKEELEKLIEKYNK